ncbi:ABC transporter substrate-binding protein [Deinococcus maricopensis]|uniref:Extracellular solute-binding protein family 1 n=1 Tax=Deinococcus maricopensis (strain DSM 21211 / LMG 22137 / NRRL B-23946 / LB-34) TaxID=709986 RepID=E8U5X5_DEIML|nr:ABC transporter substrate-binding protein [Deinococcus maricopensis]ADV66464.1 extracellular solute-binding protein family 1 [Deinococcus maricopensis DSM 21211]
MRRAAATLALALAVTAGAAPVTVTFWHSMEGVRDLVQRFADEFNRSQNQYRVVPTSVGNYRQAQEKLQGALKAGNAPVLFQAELTYFPQLVAEGRLVNLDQYEAKLDADLRRDFYPAVWNYGDYGGKRYGLPWNVSTPVLFYNIGAFKKAGVNAPRTWTEFEVTARKLSSGRRAFVFGADAWTFEQLVAARGGSVVRGDQPNFTSAEVVAALESLVRLTQAGAAQPRTLSDGTRAAVDFVRGQHVIAAASIANWTDFDRLGFLFRPGAAPMPCEKVCAVPFGGAQLVVLQGASAPEQAGAFAFWRYLMDGDTLKRWVERTAYMTPRRSVQAQLQTYYAQNPYRKAVFAQLDDAVPRPRLPEYAQWQRYLEDAILKATSGKATARAALEEAQRRAGGS